MALKRGVRADGIQQRIGSKLENALIPHPIGALEEIERLIRFS